MFLPHLSILARASRAYVQSDGTRLHSQADLLFAARLRHFDGALEGAKRRSHFAVHRFLGLTRILH